MSFTKLELEEILTGGSEQQKREAAALLEKMEQKAAKSKPLEPWEDDESGCRLVDVWFLSSDFNAEADPEFRAKLFNLARERYPGRAEEFTRLEMERKPDAFTWMRGHARMVRWANDPTGNLIGITSSIGEGA